MSKDKGDLPKFFNKPTKTLEELIRQQLLALGADAPADDVRRAILNTNEGRRFQREEITDFYVEMKRRAFKMADARRGTMTVEVEWFVHVNYRATIRLPDNLTEDEIATAIAEGEIYLAENGTLSFRGADKPRKLGKAEQGDVTVEVESIGEPEYDNPQYDPND